jgi:hypothetical protein
MLRVAQVGLHVFYRFNPHAPRPAARDEDDDDAPVFTARAATPAQQQLRLAAAVVAPAQTDLARPVAQPAPAPRAEPPKIELPPASLPIARTDTAPKGAATAPS